MLTFFVRRIIGAALVMIAVTFIVFVIFIVVPGGDTAQRIAGKNATPQNIINIRHDWKFDKPFYDALLPYHQNDRIEIREAEPYSYCQFVMGRDHTAFGRARHPWLTGSAGSHFAGRCAIAVRGSSAAPTAL